MLKPPDKTMYEYIFDTLDGIFEYRAAVEYKSNSKTGTLPDRFCVFYLVSSAPEAFYSGS